MAAQQASLSLETETLSHIVGLIEAFRAFDSDNDGKITADELGGIMGSLGYNLSEQEVRAMLQQGDKNDDGQLSLSEFLEINTKDMELGSLAAVLKSVFDAFDADEDSPITGDEFHQVVQEMGIELSLEDCRDLIASMDDDGDGAITLEDFNLIFNFLP
ncbi:hypothetical protein Nepgr_002125 [Nepenthes gracilis]|uniref:EF-hand domain-containing protein n=1 Tax=Nepenthes gracilis TaxID=150966 RepID=A0AAD3P6B8_NEPGR|nr:hypothetical protein Nepgr_002125 [Nepenthes gracilis]